MIDLIQAKITDIVNSILEKDIKDITYEEYKILDAKLKDLKYEESQAEHSKQFSELMTKAFNTPYKQTSIVEREGFPAPLRS